MRHLRNLVSTFALVALAAPAVAGCNAYRMKTPNGYAQVSQGDDGAHYKGRSNIGLRVSRFDNVEGGTLAFWSEDLVRKLAMRGYVLTTQTPTKSANGLPGTRFDFDYQPPGEDVAPRKYAVALFVSDKHIIVMQLAGEADVLTGAGTELDTIASRTKIHGCRAWTDICKGQQPGALAPAAETATAKADAKSKTQPTAQPTGEEIAEDQAAPQDG